MCITFQLTTTVNLRVGCDLMHLFFLFDEFSDRGSPEEVKSQAKILRHAISSPQTPRPQGEWIGGEIARQ